MYNVLCVAQKEGRKVKHEIPENIKAEMYDDVVRQYVRKALYRDILHDKYIEGMTFEEIAEKYGRSVRGITYICYREGDKILEHLKDVW